jgi:hypothetical protein
MGEELYFRRNKEVYSFRKGGSKQELNQEVFLPNLFVLSDIINSSMLTDHAVVDNLSPIAESQGDFLGSGRS